MSQAQPGSLQGTQHNKNVQSQNQAKELFANEGASSLYAEVIIPLHLPKNYTWAIAEDLAAAAQPGLRCEVSLRNKKYTGIIKRLFKEAPEGFSPLPIYSLLDTTPIVTKAQLQLWTWMADYYQAAEGDVMQAAVPTNFKLSSESIIKLEEDYEYMEVDTNISDEEFLLTEALQIRGELRFNEVGQILEGRRIYPVVKKLLDKGVCYIEETLKEKYKEKKATFISFHPDYLIEENLENLLNNWKGAPTQLKVLMLLRHMTLTEGDVLQAALLKKAETSASTIKALLDKGIIVSQVRSITRLPVLAPFIELDFSLTPPQQKAYEQLSSLMQQKGVNLLHGVTASGKTHLYQATTCLVRLCCYVWALCRVWIQYTSPLNSKQETLGPK